MFDRMQIEAASNPVFLQDLCRISYYLYLMRKAAEKEDLPSDYVEFFADLYDVFMSEFVRQSEILTQEMKEG